MAEGCAGRRALCTASRQPPVPSQARNSASNSAFCNKSNALTFPAPRRAPATVRSKKKAREPDGSRTFSCSPRRDQSAGVGAGSLAGAASAVVSAAAGVVAVQSGALDAAYLKRWASELGVFDVLHDLLNGLIRPKQT